MHSVRLYVVDLDAQLGQLQCADSSKTSKTSNSESQSATATGSLGLVTPTDNVLDEVDLPGQLKWKFPFERNGSLDGCVKALFEDQTFVNLRNALQSSGGEKEKALSHPITFHLIKCMKCYDLIPDGLHWTPETLTRRARVCQTLAGISQWPGGIDSNDECKLWTRKLERSLDRKKMIQAVVRTQAPKSAKTPQEDSAPAGPGTKTPQPPRRADGLFSLVNEEHSNLCRQRHARLSVELKKDTKDGSLLLAMREAQRDFASTYPRGGCPLTLVGDGVTFYFLYTQPRTTGTRYNTTRSCAFDTANQKGMRKFIKTFFCALHYARHFLSDGSSPPLPGLVPKYESFTVERLLAKNSNSTVVLLHHEDRAKRLVVKFDNYGGRASIENEMKIFRTLQNIDDLQGGIVSMVPSLSNQFLLMQYGGTALPFLCLCIPEENKRVRRLVNVQLRRVLRRLHDNGLLFVDVHPGNILLHDSKVTFADVESVRPIERGEEISWRGQLPATCYATVKRKDPLEWPSKNLDRKSLKNVLKWINDQQVDRA